MMEGSSKFTWNWKELSQDLKRIENRQKRAKKKPPACNTGGTKEMNS